MKLSDINEAQLDRSKFVKAFASVGFKDTTSAIQEKRGNMAFSAPYVPRIKNEPKSKYDTRDDNAIETFVFYKRDDNLCDLGRIVSTRGSSRVLANAPYDEALKRAVSIISKRQSGNDKVVTLSKKAGITPEVYKFLKKHKILNANDDKIARFIISLIVSNRWTSDRTALHKIFGKRIGKSISDVILNDAEVRNEFTKLVLNTEFGNTYRFNISGELISLGVSPSVIRKIVVRAYKEDKKTVMVAMLNALITKDRYKLKDNIMAIKKYVKILKSVADDPDLDAIEQSADASQGEA